MSIDTMPLFDLVEVVEIPAAQQAAEQALQQYVEGVAERLATMTLREAWAAWRALEISEDAFVGYRHVWALHRSGPEVDRSWWNQPESDAARRFAAAIMRRVPGTHETNSFD